MYYMLGPEKFAVNKTNSFSFMLFIGIQALSIWPQSQWKILLQVQLWGFCELSAEYKQTQKGNILSEWGSAAWNEVHEKFYLSFLVVSSIFQHVS